MNKLPSVYQIEVFSRCNLRCPFCLTGIVNKPPEYLSSAMDMQLFQTIVDRDLGNTRFLELQMRGEPTLHKNLLAMVRLISDKGILVGFSTHGGTLAKNNKALCAALNCHYVTISIDAGTKEGYEAKRVGGNWESVVEGISKLIEFKGDEDFPIIDLQLIEENYGPNTWQRELTALEDLAFDLAWEQHVNIRTLPNSNLRWKDPTASIDKSAELCLNPWLSVSIKANGDVVPCCMSFEDDPAMLYGNLADQSLEEIWASPTVEKFRMLHTQAAGHGQTGLPKACADCTNRSPVLFHDNLIFNALSNQIGIKKDV